MAVQRKKSDDTLVLALACGATVETAARQADLSERTVYTRLKDRAFQVRLREVRADMTRRAAGMLTAAAGEAVRTLLALLKESNPATVRLGAARAVLEVGIKVREVAELEVELLKLEDRLDALAPPEGGGRRW
ncbi:MAG TPA: hypothetical protein VH092_25770 [Urbifossiella sp.]|jgi:hypothetical protein|nr:hypothetical protein [Urbifossiella sp.]